MFFFKKTQAELDAAFLEAVGEYNFKKAKKLLAKGANAFARDADGDTALHQLAVGDPNRGDCHKEYGPPRYDKLDEFICFLLNKKVEINAVNKTGKTCLHYVAANERDGYGEMAGILLNRGADPNIPDLEGRTPLHCAASEIAGNDLIRNGAHVNVQDRSGKTPLHVAASKGQSELAHLYIRKDRSAVAVKDKLGRYPHDSAIAGLAGHHALSRHLLNLFNAYNADLQKAQKQKDLERSAASASNSAWILLTPEQVAHVKIEKSLGYKLTEVFNFHARTYTLITQNIETRVEGTIVKSFDDFSDKTLLKDGYREFIRLGGKADEGTIYRQTLNKGAAKLPRPDAG